MSVARKIGCGPASATESEKGGEMSTSPRRIQRRRTKGWTMPPGAIYVGRPGKWGNPFPWRGDWAVWAAVAVGCRADLAGRKTAAVLHFRDWLLKERPKRPPVRDGIEDAIEFESGLVVSTAECAQNMAADFAWAYRHTVHVPQPPGLDEIRSALRNHDLACWCHLCDTHRDGLPMGVKCPNCQPCHGDVLLEIANG